MASGNWYMPTRDRILCEVQPLQWPILVPRASESSLLPEATCKYLRTGKGRTEPSAIHAGLDRIRLRSRELLWRLLSFPVGSTVQRGYSF